MLGEKKEEDSSSKNLKEHHHSNFFIRSSLDQSYRDGWDSPPRENGAKEGAKKERTFYVAFESFG